MDGPSVGPDVPTRQVFISARDSGTPQPEPDSFLIGKFWRDLNFFHATQMIYLAWFHLYYA